LCATNLAKNVKCKRKKERGEINRKERVTLCATNLVKNVKCKRKKERKKERKRRN